MAIRNIREMGEEVLSKKCKLVTEMTPRTKELIEDMLDTICVAFSKQLDNLYGEEAMDISADITVMEQMLAQEGLGGMTLGGQ